MKKRSKFSKVAEDIPQALSIRYNNLVYELQRKKKDVIVLSLGESFFDIPLFSFKELDYVKGYHYSHSRGIIEMRKKICAYYKKLYGASYNPDSEVLVSAGSKAIIYMTLRALLNPGDEVIIFEPAWVSYTEQVRLSYGTPVMVPYYEGVSDVKKYITKQTRAIIINNPNNPSGKVYSKKELQMLYSIAKEHDLHIISDEAYSDFVDEDPFFTMGLFDKKKERVIVVNSLSKNLGMSGLRIGYCFANEHIIDLILKINQHLITCPATLMELYAIRYLDEILKHTFPQIRKVLRDRKTITQYMDSIGLTYMPGSGTFYFAVSIAPSKLSSEEFAMKLLKERHVATVPGIGYGESVDAFLRVSIGTEPLERIKQGLDAIKALIDKTS